jgi:hypothetical protein
LEESRCGLNVLEVVVGSNSSQSADICNHRPFRIAVVERKHDLAQLVVMLEVIRGGWEKLWRKWEAGVFFVGT